MPPGGFATAADFARIQAEFSTASGIVASNFEEVVSKNTVFLYLNRPPDFCYKVLKVVCDISTVLQFMRRECHFETVSA
jgi:hypothetical protein